MTDIQEVYMEDTVGRKYRAPIVSKRAGESKGENGEMTTLNLNEPISKSEFRKLSDALKVMYIQNLHKTYGVTMKQIAEMLGYNVSHFSSSVISRLNLKGQFKGRRPTQKQLALWKKFLKSAEPVHETQTKQELKRNSIPPAMVCNCSFTLKGELKVQDIAERIHAMVADGTPCSISVAIDALNENN